MKPRSVAVLFLVIGAVFVWLGWRIGDVVTYWGAGLIVLLACFVGGLDAARRQAQEHDDLLRRL